MIRLELWSFSIVWARLMGILQLLGQAAHPVSLDMRASRYLLWGIIRSFPTKHQSVVSTSVLDKSLAKDHLD